MVRSRISQGNLFYLFFKEKYGLFIIILCNRKVFSELTTAPSLPRPCICSNERRNLRGTIQLSQYVFSAAVNVLKFAIGQDVGELSRTSQCM